MSKPQPGALAAAPKAASAKVTTTTTVGPSSKQQPAVHITPLSVPPSQAPSTATTNPPSSPPRSRPASADSDDASRRPGSINSQTVAWDQAVLRIEYLVLTMTTPSPYSPILSFDNAPHMHGPLSPLAVATNSFPLHSPPATPTDHSDGRGMKTDMGGDAAADGPPATKGWPSVPRDKVRRKVLQIDTWRAEVAAYGAAAFCACSSPAPMKPVSGGGAGLGGDNTSKQPIPPPDATGPASLVGALSTSPGGNAIPPPIAMPPSVNTCGFCNHPPSPFVALKSPTVAAGVKKAFVDGFRGLLRRRSGSRKGRGNAKVTEIGSGDPEKGKPRPGRDGDVPPRAGEIGRRSSAGGRDSGDTFPRTAMYRVDVLPSEPRLNPESQSHQGRQSPDGNRKGEDSNDGDEEEVDLDNLSQSSNPRGLLQSNDRLKRAERLLAKGRGGGAKASGAGEGTKSLPIGEGGGGGTGSGFGLGWGKNNGGNRSRKGFGKLL